MLKPRPKNSGKKIRTTTVPIPADLLTASASGLDPDLSPDSIRAQAPRVARTRGISTDQLDQLVAQSIQQPDLGVLGEPRVNVLKLNLALDQQFPRKQASLTK